MPGYWLTARPCWEILIHMEIGRWGRDVLPAACRSVSYVWGRIAWLFMGGWRLSNRKLNG